MKKAGISVTHCNKATPCKHITTEGIVFNKIYRHSEIIELTRAMVNVVVILIVVTSF